LRDRIGVALSRVISGCEEERAIDVCIFEVSKVFEGGEEVVFCERLERVFPCLTGEEGSSTFEVGETFWSRRGGGGEGTLGAVLQDADESFNPTVAGEDFSDSRGGGGEVGEVVEGVDEREGGGRSVESCGKGGESQYSGSGRRRKGM
jgi:hypothetical protein